VAPWRSRNSTHPHPHQVFKVRDPAYAQAALGHAQELYALATLLPANGTYCAEVWCSGPGWSRFPSSSVFDDMSLAAAWLYAATGECDAGARALSLGVQAWSPACRARILPGAPRPPPPPSHASDALHTPHTGVRAYAVDAEFFYRQHQLTEAPRPLPPAAYAPSVDNSAWAAAMLLARHLDFGPAKQDLASYFRGMRGTEERMGGC
jgi:hypothetical protein